MKDFRITGFLGFLLWVFGIGLTASLTFETGAPVPIFAAGAIWLGTWLATTSRFTDTADAARHLEKSHDDRPT